LEDAPAHAGIRAARSGVGVEAGQAGARFYTYMSLLIKLTNPKTGNQTKSENLAWQQGSR